MAAQGAELLRMADELLRTAIESELATVEELRLRVARGQPLSTPSGGRWVGTTPALSELAVHGKFGPFCTICRVPVRSAGKIWAFYSVSGEIPARSAGKFWGTCVASVKFCSLDFFELS